MNYDARKSYPLNTNCCCKKNIYLTPQQKCNAKNMWLQVNEKGFTSTETPYVYGEFFEFNDELFVYTDTGLYKMIDFQKLIWEKLPTPNSSFSSLQFANFFYIIPIETYIYLFDYITLSLFRIEAGEDFSSSWEVLNNYDSTGTNPINVRAMYLFKNQVYGVSYLSPSGFDIVRTTLSQLDTLSPQWDVVFPNSLGDNNNSDISFMLEYNNKLYIGSSNSTTGIQIWSSLTGDSGSWTQDNTTQFNDSTNEQIGSAIVYNSNLFIGTNSSVESQLWYYNGTTWTDVNINENPSSFTITSIPGMSIYNNNLSILETGDNVCRIMSYNYTSYTKLMDCPSNNNYIQSKLDCTSESCNEANTCLSNEYTPSSALDITTYKNEIYLLTADSNNYEYVWKLFLNKNCIETAGSCKSLSIGYNSNSTGCHSVALGDCSHAEGCNTLATAKASHSEGGNSQATGCYSHAENFSTLASGDNSHSEGLTTTANGTNSHAEGESNVSSGYASHTEGMFNVVNSGLFTQASHAEGYANTITGDFTTGAHVEGGFNNVNQSLSHAEGVNNSATGFACHVEGNDCTASGDNSHAEGLGTTASAQASSSTGTGTIAYVDSQTVIGKYNSTTNNPSPHPPALPLINENAFIIGNGTSNSNRNNAFRVTFYSTSGTAGNAYAQTFIPGGADYAEMFEWFDENLNLEDRIGYFVTLKGDKIIKATSSKNYILGVTSVTAGVIGDAAGNGWINMYIKDEWGRVQYELVDIIENELILENGKPVIKEDGSKLTKEVIKQVYVPKVNPLFNPKKEYVSRTERSEWCAVGMIGKLLVRQDGSCEIDGYCTSNNDGIATKSETGYRVLKVISDNQVLILFK